jgi:hypothetical protein
MRETEKNMRVGPSRTLAILAASGRSGVERLFRAPCVEELRNQNTAVLWQAPITTGSQMKSFVRHRELADERWKANFPTPSPPKAGPLGEEFRRSSPNQNFQHNSPKQTLSGVDARRCSNPVDLNHQLRCRRKGYRSLLLQRGSASLLPSCGRSRQRQNDRLIVRLS